MRLSELIKQLGQYYLQIGDVDVGLHTASSPSVAHDMYTEHYGTYLVLGSTTLDEAIKNLEAVNAEYYEQIRNMHIQYSYPTYSSNTQYFLDANGNPV